MDILAIGAHPDDIELGCGGLLIKAARNGHNVHMLSMTRGAAGGDSDKRVEELNRSARFIGAKNLWIDNFIDSRLHLDSDLINHIEHFINLISPDIIITHSKGDVHHDHRAVSDATMEAARFNSNVLSYEIPLSKNFEPEVFYDITDVVDLKVELIEIFWTQQSKLYLKANAIKGLAEYRALQSRLNTSVKYAEAFTVSRLCFDKDFSLFKTPYHKPIIQKAFKPQLDEILQIEN